MYLKTKKRYKFWICMICSLFLMVLCIAVHPSAEESDEMYIPEDSEYMDASDVRRFAYMDLNKADESLKPKILQARNIIISNSSWVADGINGYKENRETGEVTALPHFSEIFPSDWEMPTYPPHDAEK